jgi:hypothetical protein
MTKIRATFASMAFSFNDSFNRTKIKNYVKGRGGGNALCACLTFITVLIFQKRAPIDFVVQIGVI